MSPRKLRCSPRGVCRALRAQAVSSNLRAAPRAPRGSLVPLMLVTLDDVLGTDELSENFCSTASSIRGTICDTTLRSKGAAGAAGRRMVGPPFQPATSRVECSCRRNSLKLLECGPPGGAQRRSSAACPPDEAASSRRGRRAGECRADKSGARRHDLRDRVGDLGERSTRTAAPRRLCVLAHRRADARNGRLRTGLTRSLEFDHEGHCHRVSDGRRWQRAGRGQGLCSRGHRLSLQTHRSERAPRQDPSTHRIVCWSAATRRRARRSRAFQ